MNDDPATILVIEDDAATATFLADNLTADGYEVHVADCASDALRLLETKYPDVALVDVGLPDASGLEILRRVRAADGIASRANPAIPFLVLSGRCAELDRIRALQAGADDVLGKPTQSLCESGGGIVSGWGFTFGQGKSPTPARNIVVIPA